jgi:hypothetical protein
MIKNVPTADDFTEHGFMFLNLAWDTIFNLLLDLSEIEDCDSDVDDEQAESYWKAGRKPLSVAHALAQQGAELTLKAQVATVSPFLLVTAPPADWPRGCDKADTSFADFRTADAQDLVRACNAVRGSPLPEQFVTTFDKFRKQRNALFHTVDDRLEFSEKEIVRYILGVAQLMKPGQWPRIRKEYLEETPVYKAYAVDDVTNQLCREMDIMVKISGHADLLEWFGFNKRQRRYICPRCYGNLNWDYDPPYPRTAQLAPNTPKSTNLHCFVCDSDIPVIRRRCQEAECKGNVINATDDCECLTCFEAQGEA